MRAINKDLLDLGRARYQAASGLDDMERDKDGFIILKPTAKRVDEKMTNLTTNISTLEEKLKQYRAEKEKTEKITKTDEYKESKKKLSKKKIKKQKNTLLEMVFNDADSDSEDDEDEDDDEEGTYRESKKTAAKKKSTTTLETTYGKRFSPVVAMLHDTITEFDAIAADIDHDLKTNKNAARTMYKASQIGNLISAKNSKLSAVKELASVAKTLSDLEYKKEKDKKASEGSDSSKQIATAAARFLRGNLDDFDTTGKKSKKKGKDKDKGKKSFGKGGFRSTSSFDDDDDDEDPYGSIDKGEKKRAVSDDEQRALAGEFAKTLLAHKDEISFSPWEKNIKLEGSYNICVIADPLDTNHWDFVAVSNKSGKIIEDFKDKYPGLLPKKKKCKMEINLSKMKAIDRVSAKSYRLMLTK